MTTIEKFTTGKGVTLKPKKVKVEESKLTSSSKQIEVLMRIARDLGYVV